MGVGATLGGKFGSRDEMQQVRKCCVDLQHDITTVSTARRQYEFAVCVLRQQRAFSTRGKSDYRAVASCAAGHNNICLVKVQMLLLVDLG